MSTFIAVEDWEGDRRPIGVSIPDEFDGVVTPELLDSIQRLIYELDDEDEGMYELQISEVMDKALEEVLKPMGVSYEYVRPSYFMNL